MPGEQLRLALERWELAFELVELELERLEKEESA